MPPCAATVWLRVGNTLVMQAVLRPAAHAQGRAQARAAGADDDDVVDVIDDRIGLSHGDSASESDAQHGEDAGDGERERDEAVMSDDARRSSRHSVST